MITDALSRMESKGDGRWERIAAEVLQVQRSELNLGLNGDARTHMESHLRKPEKQATSTSNTGGKRQDLFPPSQVQKSLRKL